MKKSTEITSTDLDNIEFEIKVKKEDTVNKVSDKSHYVNNKALYEEFVKYNKRKVAAREKFNKKLLKTYGFTDMEEVNGLDSATLIQFNRDMKSFVAPPLSDKIGKAIMQIANRRCYSPRFVNYAPNWKEEMISDAIETCVRYAHNFDPTKYDNPFAYLTQLVTNAVFQRIKKEHKQQYIKLKLFDNSHGFVGELDENNVNIEDMDLLDETNEMYHDRLQYIDNYEHMQGLNKKRAKRQSKKDTGNILDME